MSQEVATEVAKWLSNRENDEIRTYMVDAAARDSRILLAPTVFIRNIGFNSNCFLLIIVILKKYDETDFKW